MSTLCRGGVEKLTSIKQLDSGDENEAEEDQFDMKGITKKRHERGDSVADYDENESILDETTPLGALLSMSKDDNLNAHLESFDGGKERGLSYESATFIPPAMLNYNHPWRKSHEYPDEKLGGFVQDTSVEKYRFDQQVTSIHSF